MGTILIEVYGIMRNVKKHSVHHHQSWASFNQLGQKMEPAGTHWAPPYGTASPLFGQDECANTRDWDCFLCNIMVQSLCEKGSKLFQWWPTKPDWILHRVCSYPVDDKGHIIHRQPREKCSFITKVGRLKQCKKEKVKKRPQRGNIQLSDWEWLLTHINLFNVSTWNPVSVTARQRSFTLNAAATRNSQFVKTCLVVPKLKAIKEKEKLFRSTFA